jgi:methyl-accepting chemotaxis protein
MFIVFAGILIVLGGVIVFSIFQINHVGALTETIYAEPLPITRGVLEAEAHILEMQSGMKDLILGISTDDIAQAAAFVEEQETEVYEHLEQVGELIQDEEGKVLFDQVMQEFEAWTPIRDEIVDLMLTWDKQAASRIARDEGADQVNLLQGHIKALNEYAGAQAEAFHIQAQKTSRQSTTIMFILLLVSLLLTLIFSTMLANNITEPIKCIVAQVERLAAGDLTSQADDRVNNEKINQRGDELSQLNVQMEQLAGTLRDVVKVSEKIAEGDLTMELEAKGDNDQFSEALSHMIVLQRKMVAKLKENVGQLGVSSEQLTISADSSSNVTGQIAKTMQEIAKGTQNQTNAITNVAVSMDDVARAIEGLAKGAQEQASAVAQASTTASDISRSVQQVAASAEDLTHQAGVSADAAREGAKTVDETIQGMIAIKSRTSLSAAKIDEMSKRSQEIGIIVETIEDIASQTNLLALNAAIEAARAGEHGKGFAVVADEVRSLAERSAKSTKEINALIVSIHSAVKEASQAMKEGAEEVELGVERANLAGKSLKDILEGSGNVLQQAEQVRDASEQMNQASARLVDAIDVVSAVVEENTAATEEMSASTAEVHHAVESIASISEESSASVEEVSASAEEMTAQAEEVTNAAVQLEEMAQFLNTLIGQYQLPENGMVSEDAVSLEDVDLQEEPVTEDFPEEMGEAIDLEGSESAESELSLEE